MEIIMITLWLTNGDINGQYYKYPNMDHCESRRELMVEIHGDNHLLFKCININEDNDERS